MSMLQLYGQIIFNNIIIVLTAHGGGGAFLPLFKERYKELMSENIDVFDTILYVVSSLPGPISVELAGVLGYYLTGTIIGLIISVFSYILIPIIITYYADNFMVKLQKKSWYYFFEENVMAIIFASLLVFLFGMIEKNIIFPLQNNLFNQGALTIIFLTFINIVMLLKKFKNHYLIIFNIGIVALLSVFKII